jgi:hypothetical protein
MNWFIYLVRLELVKAKSIKVFSIIPIKGTKKIKYNSP